VTEIDASAGRRFAGTGALEAIVASVREEVPELSGIATQELRRITRAELGRAHAAARDGRAPSPDELDASAAVTARLARAGVPLDAVSRWRRIAVRRSFEEARGDSEDLYRLWDWADAVAARAAAAYMQVEAAVQDRDRDKRAAFVRGLLEGALSAPELQSRAAAYGLLPGRRYLTVRGRPAPDGDVARLQGTIEASGEGGLVAVVDGEVWAVLSRRPEIESDGVVAVGPTSELRALHDSFALATRALETATAFGLSGVVSIDDLSLQPAILSEEHVGGRLVGRYLEPLRELGEYGATLEQSVREYLASGMRVDPTARALIVHPNTLRHRIERFQQLTGADLRRTEDVVEVWWALERARVAS
jgi:PucR-like helix-turn-helix protein/diguanylate cyclase with GGDEF domain